MTWPLALVLIAALGAIAYGVRCWKRVEVARYSAEMEKHRTTRAISSDMRASAERLDRQVQRFEKLTGAVRSDNLVPVSTVPRPHFGTRPHLAVDNEQPTDPGAA